MRTPPPTSGATWLTTPTRMGERLGRTQFGVSSGERPEPGLEYFSVVQRVLEVHPYPFIDHCTLGQNRGSHGQTNVPSVFELGKCYLHQNGVEFDEELNEMPYL